jgi:hydrogenase maturation protease
MRLAVLGIGNVLVGDDGFGPYVVKTFQARYAVASNVDVVDAGTPGGDLVPLLAGYDAVILVDTVRAEAEPGSIRTYSGEEILSHPLPSRTSPHDPGLANTLLLLQVARTGPARIVLIGAVPASLATGTGLSHALQGAVPEALECICAELAALGAPATLRAEPLEAEIWWERQGKG